MNIHKHIQSLFDKVLNYFNKKIHNFFIDCQRKFMSTLMKYQKNQNNFEQSNRWRIYRKLRRYPALKKLSLE